MATQAQIDAYKNSQAYRDFQKSMEGGVSTMDMYDSPYFGSTGSGSQGRAQDKSFEDWLAANPNAGSTTGGGNKSATGGAETTTIDPSQSTLSPNFAPYVYDMLSRGQGLANLPYQEYTGQRFAGPSELQNEAFKGIRGLGTPSQFGTASNLATQAGQAAGNLSYTPSGGPSFGQVTSGYQAPGAYQAGTFNTGLGQVGSIQDYMSPYMTGVTDIAGREARRQSDITQQAQQAKLAQAGAFGGGRDAIMRAEMARNLGTQLEDITTKGLQSAYDRAMQQRMQESQLGLTAQQAGEQSRQFGAQQGMQGAQQAAQFGLTAQQANQQAALDAARQTEQSRQFGANLGLQGIQQQLGAAQTLGSLGTQQQQAGIAGLREQLSAGATQQQQAQSPLDFAYQQFQESMKYPYQQATYMQSLLQGLPLAARPYEDGQSGLGSMLQGGLSGLALYNMLNKKP